MYKTNIKYYVKKIKVKKLANKKLSYKKFEAVHKWKNDMDAKVSLGNQKPIHVVLLANKCDMLRSNGIFNQQRANMDTFCEENGFIGWFETSAALGVGIDDATRCLLEKIFQDTSLLPKKQQQEVIVPRRRKEPQNDTGCC